MLQSLMSSSVLKQYHIAYYSATHYRAMDLTSVERYRHFGSLSDTGLKYRIWPCHIVGYLQASYGGITWYLIWHPLVGFLEASHDGILSYLIWYCHLIESSAAVNRRHPLSRCQT
jgi:hypothetical protein